MKCLVIFTLINCIIGAILGIDYGEKFTKAVLLAPGISFEIVLTDEGKRKDLSGIAIRPDSKNGIERIYGSQMGSLITRFPSNCILDIKQLIGKKFDDPIVEKYMKTHFGSKLVEDKTRGGSIKFDLNLNNSSYEFSVEELLAMTLNDIKLRALNDLEENPNAAALVEDVAISIPPFATQATRQAYLDSLYLANFSNVLGLVEEGTSVALNFASNKKFENADYNDVKEYYLVYDVGAGYTTATLFSITPTSNGQIVLEIESVGSDELFGGKTLTDSIFTIVFQKFLNHFNLEEDNVPTKVLARLYEAAEKAKIILSANNEFHTTLESIYDDKDFKFQVTRQEFEDINSDLMDCITKPIEQALQNVDLKVDDIKSVVLNGGSTRVPFVQKHVSLFVGYDKISKSVNTDESSALGTTQIGLNLKTRIQNSKDINLIEKSHHNFEISIDENDEQIPVFSRGTIVGTSRKVNLNTTSNKDLVVSLYEDGSLIKSYKIDDLASQFKRSSCKSKEKKELVATFELNKSKMFDLTKLEVECLPKLESFFNKLLNKNDDNESQDDKNIELPSNTTNTTAEQILNMIEKRSKSTYVSIPSPIYPHIQPIDKHSRKKLLNKLSYLNDLDDAKIELTEVKNQLETQLYKLREFVETNESTLQKELEESEISGYVDYVAETIEWLDFESDDTLVEELKSKINEVQDKEAEIKTYIQMSTADLSKEGVQKLYDDGTQLMMTIQSSMLKFGQKISEIRAKFEESNLDFDKENDRIKNKLKASDKEEKLLSFDKNLQAYKDTITKIGELLSYPEKKFNKISKKELYSYHDQLAKGVADMVLDLMGVESSHMERVKLFDETYDKLIERQKQKEFRKKLREAAKAQKKQQKEEEQPEEKAEDEELEIVEDEDVEKVVEEKESLTSTSVQSQNSHESNELDHDEL
ncbi:LHS1 [Candida pseudojiufengensis]|uniref:LHS1 n=1 Tax=Candida pseudojiufengensis TaxID=497109 RepID=UPI0022246113|nr:LHS1 [Candida pseudojiufengensis]KAI5964692.1 LHS1 [Candida pseudojiufengensis]